MRTSLLRHYRLKESPKEEHAREERKEHPREKIEWRGEDGRSRQRSAEREKRARESPTRSERRHGSRHAKVKPLLVHLSIAIGQCRLQESRTQRSGMQDIAAAQYSLGL